MKDRVKNVPPYAKEYKYWVVRVADGEMWFYGAWNEEDEANRVAKELGNGLVIE